MPVKHLEIIDLCIDLKGGGGVGYIQREWEGIAKGRGGARRERYEIMIKTSSSSSYGHSFLKWFYIRHKRYFVTFCSYFRWLDGLTQLEIN